MDNIIDRHDLPLGHFLDTKEAMKIAFGFLWMSWIDTDDTDGTAASMAKHLLLNRLSHDECGEGITLARQMRAASDNAGGGE